VGTREPTALAEELAHLLAYQLASAGVTVVSGGARGIDHAAHRGALEGGGATIIVLPAGLAALESHRWDHWLADDHVADRMLFLSPFPPETPISRQTPVIRNRLTAALAEAVVVVEAGQTSGTWHCVRHAESLAVPVFVPGNPGAGSRGSGRRIFEARSVSSSDLARDVLAAARWFREREELARAAQLSFLPEEL
jgi:DNA processing protein